MSILLMKKAPLPDLRIVIRAILRHIHIRCQKNIYANLRTTIDQPGFCWIYTSSQLDLKSSTTWVGIIAVYTPRGGFKDRSTLTLFSKRAAFCA